MRELPSPICIKQKYPANGSVLLNREVAKKIFERIDNRLVAIVGPCSVHDVESALEYACRLKELLPKIEHSVFPLMRVFFEKPRTALGWKGMLYDPNLDGSNDIVFGLEKTRDLLVKIANMGIAIASELLEPNMTRYFDDLLTWGIIGARTVASQPHRQLASGVAFPVGFKNDCQGNIDEAICGIIAARHKQCYVGVNERGGLGVINTEGNGYVHLVLRGSNTGNNYQKESVAQVLAELKQQKLPLRLMIDCSHGNSNKDHRLQKKAFESVVSQCKDNKAIFGFMLESHLFEGKQILSENPAYLRYGISITDACLGWEETEELLRSVN